MTTPAKKPAAQTPAKAKAPAKPRASRAKAAEGETVKVDGEVTANARSRTTEKTKRGPGRPRKIKTGNLYEVTYNANGKASEAPMTKVVRAPDESTAICKANGLNGLERTWLFNIRATLIDESGTPLDTDYDLISDEFDDDGEIDESKPETVIDPLQRQQLPQNDD